MQMAEKAVYQIKRYNQSNKLFDTVVKKPEKQAKKAFWEKVLIIKGEVREWTPGRWGTGRAVFIPGWGACWFGLFRGSYQFIDKESGKVIYETDLRTSSTGSMIPWSTPWIGTVRL